MPKHSRIGLVRQDGLRHVRDGQGEEAVWLAVRGQTVVSRAALIVLLSTPFACDIDGTDAHSRAISPCAKAGQTRRTGGLDSFWQASRPSGGDIEIRRRLAGL